jgi:hypothetical protein
MIINLLIIYNKCSNDTDLQKPTFEVGVTLSKDDKLTILIVFIGIFVILSFAFCVCKYIFSGNQANNNNHIQQLTNISLHKYNTNNASVPQVINNELQQNQHIVTQIDSSVCQSPKKASLQ